MQKTFYDSHISGIPEKDFQLICDVVEHYPGKTFKELEKILVNIFLQDISSEHFIMLGLAIGQMNATGERVQIINQITNLCLRKN
jgi:hypothetical protein